MKESNLSFKDNARSKARSVYNSTRCILKKSKYAGLKLITFYKSEIPQASIEDAEYVEIAERDWRSFFSCRLQGKGLEIGPLHRPMVRHDGMDMDYIDRYSVAELREHYPELKKLDLVEPNIIGNAEDLASVSDHSYDFLISAHVIEHMRNPIAALENWCRVVRPGGLIYLIVPDKRYTFDKERVRTTIAHIVQDYKNPSIERDYEHYLDYVIHVDGENKIEDALKHAQRLIDTDYSIHFHVFLPTDIVNLIKWFSKNVRKLKIVRGPCKYPHEDEFHFLLEVV